MARLLDDLLATARTRSDAFPDADVDLAALASAGAAEYRAMAERRGLRLEERIFAGPTTHGDRDALARAASNLLSNAVRLAPVGSTVTVGVGSVQGWAWVAVADEGPGVPEEARGQIFDRFHRGPDSQGGGTGLGLAISRQIAESHNGQLRVTGHGQGSTFTLWLPDWTLDRATERAQSPPELDPLASQPVAIG